MTTSGFTQWFPRLFWSWSRSHVHDWPCTPSTVKLGSLRHCSDTVDDGLVLNAMLGIKEGANVAVADGCTLNVGILVRKGEGQVVPRSLVAHISHATGQ